MGVRVRSFGASLILTVLASAGSAQESAPPHPGDAPVMQPFTAEYRVRRSGFTLGEIRSRLDRGEAPGTWVWETRAAPRGLAAILFGRAAEERSSFLLEDGQILPLDYVLDDGEHHTTARFDWSARVVAAADNELRAEHSLAPGTLERHVLSLQLMLDAARGQLPERLLLVEREHLKEYHFEVETSGSVEVPYGRLDSLLVRQSRPGSERDFLIWLAPELGYLPVRYDIIKDGSLSGRIELEALTRR